MLRGAARLADYVLQANGGLQGGTRGVEGDGPGLVADYAVDRDAAPFLEGLDRGFGVWAEITVDGAGGGGPFGGAVGEGGFAGW